MLYKYWLDWIKTLWGHINPKVCRSVNKFILQILISKNLITTVVIDCNQTPKPAWNCNEKKKSINKAKSLLTGLFSIPLFKIRIKNFNQLLLSKTKEV